MKRKNRNVAAEILEGLKEFKAHRDGKLTLRTTKVEPRPLIQVTAEFIRSLRERLNVSRGLLARRLRIHTRTLEKWEQSTAPIKGASALLLALVAKYPDILARLDDLDDQIAA